MRAFIPSLLLAGAVFWLGCHEVHFEERSGAGEILVYDDLFSVDVVNENKAVASGYWGAIYFSDDGGLSWSQGDTGTNRLIYDVSMADENTGWAVGQVGVVLRTTDGGRTWKLQPTPKDEQQVHLFAVQAIDTQRAWAVGEWGTRIYTDDGGETWEDRSLTIDAQHPMFVWLPFPDQERVRKGEKVFEDVGLGDVYCLPSNTERCWIIGEFAYLFRSEDGGETWEKGKILSGTEAPVIEFEYNQIELSDEQVELVREFARSIETKQHLNVAIEPYANAKEIEKFGDPEDPFPLFEIIDARTQEIVTAVLDVGINTDRIRRRGQPPWDYEDYLEDDPEFLTRWLEGRRAEKPSVVVDIAQNPYLFTVRFADENEGYIAGLGGVVLRTSDGGRTWTYEGIGRKMAVFSVQPFRDGRALVVGEKGLARVSEDAGKSWGTIDGYPEIFTYMRDIGFDPDERVGFAVGQNGWVLRSTDRGATWSRVLPPDKQAELAAN